MPILNWLGKDKVINHHQQVPYRVLEPQYTHGQADSGNMIIHGDNLDALKALLPRYEGKIKCIYIDPPYNTGNEGWVYNDNVNDPKIKKWLGEVVGREGEDLSRHDKWLCMMYPRLRLLQRLLADDGAIFISIDDNEVAQLKLICDEILGASNFKGQIVRGTGTPTGQGNAIIANEVDYVLVYAKSKLTTFNGLPFDDESAKIYNLEDEYGRYLNRPLRKTGGEDRREDRPSMFYSIKSPDDTDVYPIAPSGYESRWRCQESTYHSLVRQNRIEWKKDTSGWKVYQKFYLEGRTKQPGNLWTGIEGNKKGSLTLKNVLGSSMFSFPKPVELLSRIIQIATSPGDIILDSFAGSGTTAHAVLNMNKADGGNRKFILVEMEDYADTITAERVKRVIDGYGEGKNATERTGGGFAFCELGDRLLLDDGNLNENLDTEKIREYVWYTETRTDYTPQEEQYLLGVRANTAYYFYYNKQRVTVLDHIFLTGVKTKAGSYLIYADINALSAEEMDAANIRFKKIPRDITRL